MQNAADYYKEHEVDLYIETVKGNKFYFSRPVFDIEEIAHATSMQCRYTGHCRRFYSVAEHSLLVAVIIQAMDLQCEPFEGLLHDGTEAYLSDIAAPWKVLLPDYKKIEAELEVKLREHFKLPAKITDECKRADWIALLVEAHHLMPSRAKEWAAPGTVRVDAERMISEGLRVQCLDPLAARAEFMATFREMEALRARRVA